MTKEYGVDLAPEPLMAAQTIILPTGAKEWAGKHLEPFDAKKHNTKVVVAELLPIPQRIEVVVEPNAKIYADTAQDADESISYTLEGLKFQEPISCNPAGK